MPHHGEFWLYVKSSGLTVHWILPSQAWNHQDSASDELLAEVVDLVDLVRTPTKKPRDWNSRTCLQHRL